MGNMAIPPGCHSSIERCIDALCAEQSKGTFKLDWFRRNPEWNALGQMDDNMSAPDPRADWHETRTRVLGSTYHSKTRWGSDQRFSEAWGHQHSTPDQKAAFRQQVARDYLKDHPDDCQPPAPPPAPARVRTPVRTRAVSAKQLGLFDQPATVSGRVIASDNDSGAWWTSPAWVAVGAATALVDWGITLATSPASFLVGFNLRYFTTSQEKHPQID